MSSNESTYAGMRDEWRQMADSVAANSQELEHLEGLRIRLDAAWTRAHEIAQRQATLTAEKQQNSVELRKVMKDGERLATLMRKAVQQHYGAKAEKLVQFGVQPFRGRKPKAAPPAPTSPEIEPTPETPTPTVKS